MTASVRVRSLQALLELAQSKGTQRDLARRVGVSPTSINLLMQGKRSTVAISTAARIEDALGVERGSYFVFEDLALVRPYAAGGAA